MSSINVYSEIGKLKTVLVHRPGEEVENLTPDLLERLLFDDIPFLKVAREEHDQFAKHLKDNGVEVLYIESLVTEVLQNNDSLKNSFVDQFISEADVKKEYVDQFKKMLLGLDTKAMVDKMIAGTKKIELNINDSDKYPFVADPLPNILFQRDPFASVGDGITLHKMWSVTRNRETLFSDVVFKNHPRFQDVPYYYDRDLEHHLEGGDVLVLNKDHLIIGISQRTELKAAQEVANRLFSLNSASYKKVIALDLPKTRAFMHLDTVFTNVDYDKFIVHPLIFDNLDEFKIYEITPQGTSEIKKDLTHYLSDVLGKEVKLIRCGGLDPIVAGREQWNDGTNVITIAPGVVISYERNHITNELLRKEGITVITTPSSELSRGRGGPRCMTMPIVREDI